MLMCGVGLGKGLKGPGLLSGWGESGSINAGGAKCLFVVFTFSFCGCDGEFLEFFSADDGKLGFFACYVFG